MNHQNKSNPLLRIRLVLISVRQFMRRCVMQKTTNLVS